MIKENFVPRHPGKKAFLLRRMSGEKTARQQDSKIVQNVKKVTSAGL